MAKRSLPTQEVRGSNPVIGRVFLIPFTAKCIEKSKIKKKRPGMAIFQK